MELVLLVGAPGSGKTSHYLKHYSETHVRISQDEQGRKGHLEEFEKALAAGKNIVVDRQNHLRYQREKYLVPARDKGYTTKIVWLKVDKNLCEKRIIQRGNDHPTIKLKDNVRAIVKAFEKGLQQPKKTEADDVQEIYVPFYAPHQDLTHLKGKIGIIGDCHGVWDEVEQAVNELDLDYYVFLGDLNDRGPDLNKLLEFVRSNDNVFTLEGNHENKLARWLKGNRIGISGGFQSTMEQLDDLEDSEYEELYEWIQSLPALIRLPNNCVAVHAGLDPTKPLNKQKYATCIWIRTFGGKKFDDKDQPFWYEHDFHEELKSHRIFFGHAVHDEAHVAKDVYALDGGAVYGGSLRVAVLDTETDDITVHSYPCKEYYKKSQGDKEHIFGKRDELVRSGHLSKSEHGDLILYNYTDKTTYDNFWTKETISSRGTIYNRHTGEVVAKSFDKFFNLGEREQTEMENLPLHEDYMVFEKMDGSLGILYECNGEYKVATRGSFYSEQAFKGTKMLKKYDLSNIPKNTTLLFEIIYPDNKIIVPYGQKEELVLLAAFNYKTGEELSWKKVERIAQQAGFGLPKVYRHSLEDLVKLSEELDFEHEGWVIRFESGLRVKVKVKDYLRMAKIVAHLSPLSVWEAMLEDRDEEFMMQVPEEVRDEVEEHREHLKKQMHTLEQAVCQEMIRLKINESNDREEIKEMAQRIQKEAKPFCKQALFMLMRGKNIREWLLKRLRPTENVFVDLDQLLE